MGRAVRVAFRHLPGAPAVTWAKLDDEMLDHPKVAAAGLVGFAMHVAAIVYCARNDTDGVLPLTKVDGLLNMRGVYVDVGNPAAVPVPGRNGTSGAIDQPDPYDVAEHLVDVGLWEHREDGDYDVHDFLDYHPSKAQVAERREAKQRAGRAGADARWNGEK